MTRQQTVCSPTRPSPLTKRPPIPRFEFLALCGVIGLGRLLADREMNTLPTLRHSASDPRRRIREAVCMALRRLGDRDMDRLLRELDTWIRGIPFGQRSAVSAVCEPALLHNSRHARAVLGILDELTRSIDATSDRRSGGFKALRKALGTGWSVATVALPEEGKTLMEYWCGNTDPDIDWIMRENLNKARMLLLDAQWVLEIKRRHQP